MKKYIKRFITIGIMNRGERMRGFESLLAVIAVIVCILAIGSMIVMFIKKIKKTEIKEKKKLVTAFKLEAVFKEMM